MENESVSSIKIAINLMIIALLIFTIKTFVDVVKPTVYEKIISIINVAAEENERQFEEYDQTVVSGTKVLRILRECEDLRIGVIYQTGRMKTKSDYAKNIGTIFEGANISGIYNGHYCNEGIISNLSLWTSQHSNNEIYYISQYMGKNSNAVICKNYINAFYTDTNDEYIELDGRFYSELIKESTGGIVGLIFIQQ